MTSQDRDLRIQENVQYVDAVLAQLKQLFVVNDVLVYHGFSQGTAMACRAALLGKNSPRGVLLLGGDIPPELNDPDRLHRILIARGNQDRIYSLKQWNQDISRLKQSSLNSLLCAFSGGHGGNSEYFHTAGEFLMQCCESSSRNLD